MMISACGIVAREAPKIVMEIVKQVIIQKGTDYVTKIFSPDDAGGKPTVTVSYTNTTGYAVGASYAVTGASRVTSENVSIKNATGTIRIANDDNGISVTVADGSSGTVDIQLGNESGGSRDVPAAVGADAQAATVDGILSWSGRTRSTLYAALDDLEACHGPAGATARLRTVAEGRSQQIAALRHLLVTALPNGESLRDTLVQALGYSFQADQAFIRWGVAEESGCGHDANYRQGMTYSRSATAAKKRFVAGWNTVAGDYGLAAYQEPDI